MFKLGSEDVFFRLVGVCAAILMICLTVMVVVATVAIVLQIFKPSGG